MLNTQKLACGLVFASVLTASGFTSQSAQAAILLSVDLSVPNQITISSTTGASAATLSGSDTTGVYLVGLFGGTTNASISATLVSGNLTSAENLPDNSPSLFRNNSTDPGLNMWSFSANDPVRFVQDNRAFAGSATWNISSAAYNLLVAGPSSGDIYFPADDITDLGSATLIGQYSVVPEPLTMLGAGAAVAFGAAFKRRKAQ